jgi:hypothetical protein
VLVCQATRHETKIAAAVRGVLGTARIPAD